MGLSVKCGRRRLINQRFMEVAGIKEHCQTLGDSVGLDSTKRKGNQLARGRPLPLSFRFRMLSSLTQA